MGWAQPTFRLASPDSILPPSVLDKLYELDEHLYDVQETVDKLEYILVKHTDMLDGIAHNQAIIDYRLIRLKHDLCHQFSAVHHKLSDIIRLRSLNRWCALKRVALSTTEQAHSKAYVE